MQVEKCQLKDCKGFYPPPCYVSREGAERSKEKYGIIICRWDMKLIETGKRKFEIAI